MDTRTAYATGRRKAGRASVKKKDGNVLLIAEMLIGEGFLGRHLLINAHRLLFGPF